MFERGVLCAIERKKRTEGDRGRKCEDAMSEYFTVWRILMLILLRMFLIFWMGRREGGGEIGRELRNSPQVEAVEGYAMHEGLFRTVYRQFIKMALFISCRFFSPL